MLCNLATTADYPALQCIMQDFPHDGFALQEALGSGLNLLVVDIIPPRRPWITYAKTSKSKIILL